MKTVYLVISEADYDRSAQPDSIWSNEDQAGERAASLNEGDYLEWVVMPFQLDNAGELPSFLPHPERVS